MYPQIIQDNKISIKRPQNNHNFQIIGFVQFFARTKCLATLHVKQTHTHNTNIMNYWLDLPSVLHAIFHSNLIKILHSHSIKLICFRFIIRYLSLVVVLFHTTETGTFFRFFAQKIQRRKL